MVMFGLRLSYSSGFSEMADTRQTSSLLNWLLRKYFLLKDQPTNLTF
jgi:hypothetical protein